MPRPPRSILRQAASGRVLAPPERGRPCHDARILVAEDNPTNQDVLLAQLAKLGYEAHAVAGGSEAVEAFDRGNYDLVLMDCQMPGMDGFEATRRIRELGNPHLPIVAVTADAMAGDRDRCIREGMNDYLSKPVELDQLGEVLARWLPEFGPGITFTTGGPAASEPARSVFDAEDLLNRLVGDKQLADRIVRGFLEDFPSLLRNLRNRLDEADGPGAAFEAHALEGAAAAASAGGIRALARALEHAGTAGKWDDFHELLPRTTEEFARLKSMLEDAKWA